MEEYRVMVLSPAKMDILDVVDHANTLSPEAAEQYYTQFIDDIDALAKTPESCQLARDAQLRLRGYRILHISDYTVFFVLKDRTVDLRRVLYTRRQYERMF